MDPPPLCQAAYSISTSSLIATLHQTFAHAQSRTLKLDSTSLLVLVLASTNSLLLASGIMVAADPKTRLLSCCLPIQQRLLLFFSTVSAFPGVNPAVLQALNVLTPF